jgi:hypothetical protein
VKERVPEEPVPELDTVAMEVSAEVAIVPPHLEGLARFAAADAADAIRDVMPSMELTCFLSRSWRAWSLARG